MAKNGEGLAVDILITDFGQIRIPEKVARLNRDKRTKEGKMRERWATAYMEIEAIAYHLDMTITQAIGAEK